MTPSPRLPFDPRKVWTKAGLNPDYRPSLTHRAGWTRALFDEAIGYGRYAHREGTGLGQMLAFMPDAETMTATILVQITDRLFLREGWSIVRSLRWAAVLAGTPDAAAAQDLAAGLGWSVDSDDERKGQMPADWTVVDERLAPLAYAAGMSALEAYERQVSGVLDADALGSLAALRGYRFPAGFEAAA